LFCLDNFSNKSVDCVKEFPEVLSFSDSPIKVCSCAAKVVSNCADSRSHVVKRAAPFVDDCPLFGDKGCVYPYVNGGTARSAPSKKQNTAQRQSIAVNQQ
jgi:hypothetical protein